MDNVIFAHQGHSKGGPVSYGFSDDFLPFLRERRVVFANLPNI